MNIFDHHIKSKNNVFISIFMSLSAFFILTIYFSLWTNFNASKELKPVRAADENNFIVNSNIIGPFDDDSVNVPLNLTIRSSVYRSKVRETLTYGEDENHILHASSTAIHSMNSNQDYNVSFDFPGSQIAYFGSRYIKIIIRDENEKVILFEKSCTISKIAKDHLNANSHLRQTWNSNVLGFKIENSKIALYGDALSTMETIDYFAVDYYYRLDLSSINFMFFSEGKTYEKAHIYFEDEYNIFPDFEKKNGSIIDIDLTIHMNYMPFMPISYKSGFYVNPKNLSMSSTAKSNFKPTNYFYFPVNCLDQVSDYKFYFEIIGLGWNKSTFTLTLDYDVSRRLIGNCSTSEYCVIGEIIS